MEYATKTTCTSADVLLGPSATTSACQLASFVVGQVQQVSNAVASIALTYDCWLRVL